MADIKKELNQIKNAVYGREVRGSIHDGIDKINKESEESKGKADEAHDVMESIMEEGFDNAALEANFDQKLDDKISNLQPEWTQFKDDTETQLAETEQKKADKIEVNQLADEKADKAALAQVAQSKRDKDVEIEMKDLSQEAKEAMTGGSVAVVGKDAVGEINLKDNVVTSRKLHKNANIKYPYLSDDTFDLDYFWEAKTVIVSPDVKNNPFESGCQVTVFRGKTTESDTGNAWITQIAVAYGDRDNHSFGDAFYRHMRVSETNISPTRVGEWRKLGIYKVTNEMLDKNIMVKHYMSDETFDLNRVIDEGNYYVNKEVKNNPYGRGGSLTVFRYKVTGAENFTRIVQFFVCHAGGKYQGRYAIRSFRYNDNTGELAFVSDWSDGIEEPVKILTIGNSFGLDVTKYVHRFAESVGINVKVGCLYISGGYFEDHYNNINNNTKAYRFYRRYHIDGTITDDYLENYSVDDALELEDWDYVFFNQASAQSGVYDTFQPYLNDIISHLKSKLPSVKIALMPTQAYASDFDDARFDKYDREQLTMYNAIMSTYKQAMGDADFDIIIPVGTAIQNARTDDYLMSTDRELTRDGYHLSDTGCFIGGMTFFRTLIDKYVEVEYIPSTVDKRAAYFGNVAVNTAILNPFKITNI